MDHSWAWFDPEPYPGPDTEPIPEALLGFLQQLSQQFRKAAAAQTAALKTFVGTQQQLHSQGFRPLFGYYLPAQSGHAYIPLGYGSNFPFVSLRKSYVKESPRDRALRLKQNRNRGPIDKTTFDHRDRRRR